MFLQKLILLLACLFLTFGLLPFNITARAKEFVYSNNCSTTQCDMTELTPSKGTLKKITMDIS